MEVQTERNETGISFTLQNEEFSKFSINLFDERNASFYIERGKNSEQYDIVLEMAAEQNFVSSSFKTKDNLTFMVVYKPDKALSAVVNNKGNISVYSFSAESSFFTDQTFMKILFALLICIWCIFVFSIVVKVGKLFGLLPE